MFFLDAKYRVSTVCFLDAKYRVSTMFFQTRSIASLHRDGKIICVEFFPHAKNESHEHYQEIGIKKASPG
jgi:hypothetical protein